MVYSTNSPPLFLPPSSPCPRTCKCETYTSEETDILSLPSSTSSGNTSNEDKHAQKENCNMKFSSFSAIASVVTLLLITNVWCAPTSGTKLPTTSRISCRRCYNRCIAQSVLSSTCWTICCMRMAVLSAAPGGQDKQVQSEPETLTPALQTATASAVMSSDVKYVDVNRDTNKES